MTIIYTILIFGVIIFVHEFGHFILCRICGVKVNEFAMGMGPRILKYQGKRTLYALRLFPIGGFCAMEGEDPSEANVLGAGEGAEEPVFVGREEPFCKKSVWKRALICGAGAFMNLLLGFALMLCITIPQKQFVSTTVAGIREDAPEGVRNALRTDDRILKIDNTTIFTASDIPTMLQLSKDGVVDVTVLRDGAKVRLPQVDFSVQTEDGSLALALGFYVYPVEPTFWGTLSESARQTVSTARNSWLSIGALFTGRIGFSELSGPVGVGKYVGEAARMGLSSLISIAAFISISVGMFNLLPFPALDGGRIVFLLVEAIRRKPLNPRWEAGVNTAGLLLLFALMIAVTFKDIWNLF